jgi:hypothetical protein
VIIRELKDLIQPEIEAGAVAILDKVMPGMPWFYLPDVEKQKAFMLAEACLIAALKLNGKFILGPV